jgi:hypothetical protein
LWLTVNPSLSLSFVPLPGNPLTSRAAAGAAFEPSWGVGLGYLRANLPKISYKGRYDKRETLERYQASRSVFHSFKSVLPFIYSKAEALKPGALAKHPPAITHSGRIMDHGVESNSFHSSFPAGTYQTPDLCQAKENQLQELYDKQKSLRDTI